MMGRPKQLDHGAWRVVLAPSMAKRKSNPKTARPGRGPTELRRPASGAGAQRPSLTGAPAPPEATSRLGFGRWSITLRPWHLLVLSLLLFLVVLGVFFPVTGNDFVSYDDHSYVTENLHVQQGLNWESVRWAFHTYARANWHPLTWLSHILDCQLFGLKPWGHHLTSVLLHGLNTALLFLLFNRMSRAVGRSLVLAALFGLHPLRVESVAWVAERKDVLSAFFFMLTLWAYAAYASKSPVSSLKSPDSLKSPVSSLKSSITARAYSDEPNRREPERLETEDLRLETAGRSTLHAPRPPLSSILHPPSSFFYAGALLFFALGLMSKPMLVTLPFVLLSLDYWPLQRFRFRENAPAEEFKVQGSRFKVQGSEGNAAGGEAGTLQDRFEFKIKNLKLKIFLPLLWEKLPFLALAAVSSVITFQAQRSGGTLALVAGLPLMARLANALIAYCRYLGKLFWPANLAVFYPHPKTWPMWLVLLAAGLLGGITVLALVGRRRRPYVPTGWFWFLGTLVPVIGLVQVGAQSMADRYSYLPSIGLLLVLVWGAGDLLGRWRHRAVALSVVATAVVMLCAVGTRRQLEFWKNTGTLFRHAAEVTEDNFVAYASLGNYALREQRRPQEAIPLFQAALKLDPDFAEARHNLACAYYQQGRLDEAITQFQEAIRLDFDLAYIGLGIALAAKGRVGEALSQFEEAVRRLPESAEAHNDLAVVLAQVGRRDEAIAHLRQALKLRPHFPEAQRELRALTGPEGQTKPELQVTPPEGERGGQRSGSAKPSQERGKF